MLKLTIDALETLDMIDKKGSFAAAAGALYRVPSAITYTVQKLEQDLGVTLFKKEGRRAVLTSAGHVLLEQGREILEATDKLIETTRQVDSGWESSLTIAVDSVMKMNTLYPYLSRFYDIKPDIEISLVEEVLGGSWEAILDERADLVLGASEPPAETKGIHYQEIDRISWKFCVSPNHPLANSTSPIKEADLKPYPAVVIRDTSQRSPHLTRRLFNTQPRLYVPNIQQKIETQQAGLGVGYLPSNQAQPALESGRLIELPMEAPSTTTPLYMAWKKNNNGKALHWFINQISIQ